MKQCIYKLKIIYKHGYCLTYGGQVLFKTEAMHLHLQLTLSLQIHK